MKHFHPRKGDHGQQIELHAPSQPTAPSSWDDPNEIATVTPDRPCPLTLNGIAFADWMDAPTTTAGWEEQVAQTAATFTEPPMTTATGKQVDVYPIFMHNYGLPSRRLQRCSKY